MARHVMKEIICMDQDLHLLSGAVDLDIVDLADGGLTLPGRREIQCNPYENCNLIFHTVRKRNSENHESR